MQALVIGGTGPTGPHLVEGLQRRGWKVRILHRGTHEIDLLPPEIEHLHADPYDAGALENALEGRTFDLVIATYGRLREAARILAGRTERFIAIDGGPLYRGYMLPEDCFPAGLPVPAPENAPKISSSEELRKGFMIARTEEEVLKHHPTATILRYPFVYGPRQPAPREWCVVRRILDRRPWVILPDGGLSLCTMGYVENVAHAVMLAVDQPGAAAGQAYNCGDERVLTLRQLVEWIASLMQHQWEIICVPSEVALPARPLLMHERTHHRVLDLTKIRSELGYRDLIPTGEALSRTIRWLVDHRPEPGGLTEQILQDPFDYEAEDCLVAEYRKSLAGLASIHYAEPPGPGLSYIAPRNRAKKRADWPAPDRGPPA